jgi:hypothetical protein
VVSLSGEPGIGKSRLTAAAEAFRAGHLPVTGLSLWSASGSPRRSSTARAQGPEPGGGIPLAANRVELSALAHGRPASGRLVDFSMPLDSLDVMEQAMWHFYFRAKIEERLGDGADWRRVADGRHRARRLAQDDTNSKTVSLRAELARRAPKREAWIKYLGHKPRIDLR